MARSNQEAKDLEIAIAPQVQAAMDSDPELAAAMRECFAVMHQAHEAVVSGRYETFEDAMEAITGSRPESVDDEEDDGA